MPAHADSNRSLAQLKEHYAVERELAARLKQATREERRRLYTELYDELFRRVPHHPQLTNQSALDETRVFSRKILNRYLRPDSTYLEIGPGDCSLALSLAQDVKRVYAIDVSEEITRGRVLPENFELIISDGSSIPVPPASVSVAFSDQLMEHLHPDDALEQLRNIHRALARGGTYVCITPNRLSGPHDISLYFDDEATGFHLKEYTATELAALFKRTGFSKIHALVGTRGAYIRLPITFIKLTEAALMLLPRGFRKKVARSPVLKPVLGIKMVAVK